MARGWILSGFVCAILLNQFGTGKLGYASGITIIANTAEVDFPDSIDFHISASAAANIDRVTLIYSASAETCLDSQARHEMIFDPAPSINLEWSWDLFRSHDLPPGVEVWWQWEIHAEDGSATLTDVNRLVVEDPGFDWKKRSRGPVTLYWAEGSNAFGTTLLDIAFTSLDRLEKSANLAPIGDVRLNIYPSTEDLVGALKHTTDWMGGVAYAEYRIVMIGITPSNDFGWPKEVIPHELAHLTFDQRTANCKGGLGAPSWLNEGFAEFAEGPVDGSDREPVLAELKKGTLQPFTSLANGFPANSERARLAYRQSKMLVEFMIETYGKNKFEMLLDQFSEGLATNDALRTVYGLDTAGIDQAWRASLGFGAAPEPNFATATTAPSPTAIPTLALVSPFQKQASATPTAAPSPTFTPTTKAPSPTVEKTVAAGEQATAEPVSTSPLLADRSSILFLLAGGIFIIIIAAGVAAVLIWKKRK